MKNPFQYGSVVHGDGFCNRQKEIKELIRAMENSERLFVYSERRFKIVAEINEVVSAT